MFKVNNESIVHLSEWDLNPQTAPTLLPDVSKYNDNAKLFYTETIYLITKQVLGKPQAPVKKIKVEYDIEVKHKGDQTGGTFFSTNGKPKYSKRNNLTIMRQSINSI